MLWLSWKKHYILNEDYNLILWRLITLNEYKFLHETNFDILELVITFILKEYNYEHKL